MARNGRLQSYQEYYNFKLTSYTARAKRQRSTIEKNIIKNLPAYRRSTERGLGLVEIIFSGRRKGFILIIFSTGEHSNRYIVPMILT